MTRSLSLGTSLLVVASCVVTLAQGQGVTFDRLLQADREPHNWLTFSRTLDGHRYSPLTQITIDNVQRLEPAWLWQSHSTVTRVVEATPLVVDGTLYTVHGPNEVVALDAATGERRWTYPYTPGAVKICCLISNRGLAILGDTLFLGTLDAHLLALDARTGELRWNTTVADAADPSCRGDVCYSITHAPLVVRDRVLVGVAGGDGPTRGFIAAFEAEKGQEVWRFHTVPSEDSPARATWSGDSWKTGGAGIWNTGTYDPDLNLTYWGTGNPWPVRDGSSRLGDNLYSNSVVALDATTGALRWHYQFTPHDDMDWDAGHVPVLIDQTWNGQPRKLLVLASKNGLLYVLDRQTGQFLSGTPFVQVNWMTGFDDVGRPRRVPGRTVNDATIMPGFQATNWYPPSYSPSTGLFYLSAWEAGRLPLDPTGKPIMKQPFQPYGAIRAFDLATGERRWEVKRDAGVFQSGVLTTASDLLFTGVGGGNPGGDVAVALKANGYFYALDARTGQLLWQRSLAAAVQGSPISYAVNGQQYIAVAAGRTLWSFALHE